jgi:hypothetical protein
VNGPIGGAGAAGLAGVACPESAASPRNVSVRSNALAAPPRCLIAVRRFIMITASMNLETQTK